MTNTTLNWAQAYIPLERLTAAQVGAAHHSAAGERLDGYFVQGWHYPQGVEKAFYFVRELLRVLGATATPDEVKALVQRVGCDFARLELEPEGVRQLAYRCLAREVERHLH